MFDLKSTAPWRQPNYKDNLDSIIQLLSVCLYCKKPLVNCGYFAPSFALKEKLYPRDSFYRDGEVGAWACSPQCLIQICPALKSREVKPDYYTQLLLNYWCLISKSSYASSFMSINSDTPYYSDYRELLVDPTQPGLINRCLLGDSGTGKLKNLLVFNPTNGATEDLSFFVSQEEGVRHEGGIFHTLATRILKIILEYLVEKSLYNISDVGDHAINQQGIKTREDLLVMFRQIFAKKMPTTWSFVDFMRTCLSDAFCAPFRCVEEYLGGGSDSKTICRVIMPVCYLNLFLVYCWPAVCLSTPGGLATQAALWGSPTAYWGIMKRREYLQPGGEGSCGYKIQPESLFTQGARALSSVSPHNRLTTDAPQTHAEDVFKKISELFIYPVSDISEQPHPQPFAHYPKSPLSS